MKKLKLILPVLLLTLLACHKDTNTNNTQTQVTNHTPNGGAAVTIPSGAAGAFYAINTINYNNNGSGYDTTDIGLGYAWFGNYTTTLNAGSVYVTGDSLYTNNPNLGGLVNFPWYETDITNQFTFNGNAVTWNVQGNSANSIPAINYTDNTVFPVVNGLTLSNPVSISSSVTVHFTVTGAYDAIFYALAGSNTQQQTSFTGTNGATSATFTPAQLSAVTGSGGQLSITVMPVKLTPYTVSGKTYYFVKQGAYSVSTIVQ